MPRTDGLRFALALALSATGYGSVAHAQWRARLVARTGRAGSFHSGAVQARVGESVDVAVVLVDDGGRAYGEIAEVSTRGVRSTAIAGPLPQGARVRWLRVEPRLAHRDYPTRNPGVPGYSNSVAFGPRHGRWVGYDRLEYDTTDLAPAAGIVVEGAHATLRAATPGDVARDTHDGAGSVWLAAEVTLADGTRVRTPDGDDVDTLGLSSEVLRVSYRTGDDFLGWLSTYFNVPYVFGSNGPSAASHQTDRYTGADCADVLVGAMRAAGFRAMNYTSVAGIGEYADPVTGVLHFGTDGLARDEAGAAVRLTWGTDVRPGDLLTIDYSDDPDHQLPRAWDHIGALVRDGSDGHAADGVLDGTDVLREMAWEGLTDGPIAHQGVIRARVWRWRGGV